MLHFNSVKTISTTLLQLLYADLWGPSHVVSSQGYTYYMSILDDFSTFTWIFPLSAKSNVLPVFVSFKNFIEKHLQRNIKVVQTYWGGEFKSFSSLLNNSGIHFRYPCPHIHHRNGRIERKHRHIVDIGLTLIAQAYLPLHFLWDAFHTAVFLINRLPTPTLHNISLYQKLFHQTPDYSTLRIFGCACFPYLRPYNRHKLEFKTGRCIFIGYSSHHKGYKCLHSSRRVYISNHVIFNKKSFPYIPSIDFSSITEVIPINSLVESAPQSSSVTQFQAPLTATSAADPVSPVSNSYQVLSQNCNTLDTSLSHSTTAIPDISSFTSHSQNSPLIFFIHLLTLAIL